MSDSNLLQLPLATTGAGALLYGIQDNQDKAFPASVLQGSEQPQAANSVYAGPTQAPGNYPTFRQLVSADIPDLSSLYLASNGGSLVNATINNSSIIGGSISGAMAVFDDDKFSIRDNIDTTKVVRFEASTLSAGSSRLYSWPDANGQVVIDGATQNISNKSVWLRNSTTAAATFRIPHGQPPSAPVNGDMWTTNAGLFVQVNNATIGPLAASASSTVTTFNGRQGAVTLTSADVTNALGYTPYNPGAGSYVLKTGDTMTGTLHVNGGWLRASAWNGVTNDGVVVLGDTGSYVGKRGSTMEFANTAGGWSATLNSGGTMWTSGNFTPANYVQKVGDTMTGQLGISGAALRVYNWSGVPGNGVIYFGANDSYLYKIGSEWNFRNDTGNYTAVLNSGGTIWTSANLTPGNYVAKSGDTMSGPLTVTSGVITVPFVFQSTNPEVVLASATGTAGQVTLRPNGAGNTAGQAVVQSDGVLRVSSAVIAGQNFQSNSTAVVLGTVDGAAGNVYLRPNGGSNASGEVRVEPSGRLIVGHDISNTGTITSNATDAQFIFGGSPRNLRIAYNYSSGNAGFYDATGSRWIINFSPANASPQVSFPSGGVSVGGAVTATSLQITGAANVSGNLTVGGVTTSTGGFGPTSDPRTKDKTTFRAIDNALNKVYNLNTTIGKYHDWFNSDGKDRYFVMADSSMKQYAPELILPELSEKDNVKYDGWSADQMIALLVKAVQELTDKVDDLEGRLDEQSN